jgi:hypothetical protein
VALFASCRLPLSSNLQLPTSLIGAALENFPARK